MGKSVVQQGQPAEIVISGGGMVGASLALSLAAQNKNWHIRIVEPQPFAPHPAPAYQPSFDARSTALSVSAQEIFSALGLWSSLSSHLSPILEIDVSDRGQLGGTRLNACEEGVAALGYVVENAWLGSVLMAAVADNPALELVAPASIENLRPTKRGMALRLSGRPNEEIADLLVVADGADSPTRRKLGIAAQTTSYRQTALVANIVLQNSHRQVAYERFTRQGPIALLPLLPHNGRSRSSLVWSLPPDEAEHLVHCVEEEFLEALQQRFGFRLGRFAGVGARHCYPLQRIVSEEQFRRGLVVVGNAAHSFHPVAGQGFNLALRDAARLAETLALGAEGQIAGGGTQPGDPAVLQRYVEKQQSDQQLTSWFSDGLPRLFGPGSMTAAAARGLGFLALDLLPDFRSGIACFGMGTHKAIARIGGEG